MLREPKPISDEDYEKLKAISPDIPRDFAQTVVETARNLCGFRKVFGQSSRVVRFVKKIDDTTELYSTNMFEGGKLKFSVEYNPETEEHIRVV
jgi:hypothetical protein